MQEFKYRLINLFNMIKFGVIWIVGVSFKNIDLFKIMGWDTSVPAG